MDQDLIDRIYECSLAPEFWPGVLDKLSQMAAARGSIFFTATQSAKVLRWTASAGIHEDFASYVAGGWSMQDRRRKIVNASQHAGFLTECDLFTAEELDNDPTRRDFFRSRGLGWAAITGVSLPTGDWFVFSVDRDYVQGPVEPAIIHQLDALRPHLARSALISARLQLERARVASETLALLGLPALVLDERGKVLAANHLIEALTDHIRWRAQDRVSLKDSRANALFQQAIATLDMGSVAPVRSFAVRDAAANAAMVAHVIPIRRTARDIFVRCAGVLVMTPVTLPQAPSVELVRSLFDLTPAEARDARENCLHRRRFAQHGPHPSAWSARKDRLPSSGRAGRAA